MGQPAAKEGDKINALDTHIEITSAGVAAPIPHSYAGTINGSLSSNVNFMGKPAATVDSESKIDTPHMPSPGSAFQKGPDGKGVITKGSSSVFVNGKAVARNGDMAKTCNDPSPLEVGTVMASGTVIVG